MSFYPGQKIVCVDNSIDRVGPYNYLLRKLKVWQPYTFERTSRNGGVILVEVKHPISGVGFQSWRFRPLDEVLEEISIEQLIEEEITV